MTLKETIHKRIVDYYLRGKRQIALEISRLYLNLAGRKISEDYAIAACIEGLYWLKIAGFPLRADLTEPELNSLKEILEKSFKLYRG